MIKKIVAFIALAVYMQTALYAQENQNRTLINAALHGWEYEIRAGVSIGGTSPLPLPVEIRSIDTYNPTLALMLEGNAIKWLGKTKKWGVITGVRLETKNMITKATVKNYGMEIIGNDGNRLKGNWTGGVKTKVRNAYITVPVLGAYKINSRLRAKAGAYVSYLMDEEFSGYVYEGYLREGNPTGKKVNFEIAPRRPGDPAKLIACSDRIKSMLKWQPKYESAEQIIESAWKWQLKHPDGYKN